MMKFYFDIHYSLFDILRFKKILLNAHVTNVRNELSE